MLFTSNTSVMKSFSTYISAFLYSDFRKTFCFFQRFILFKLNTILKQDVMLLMATSFYQYHLISPQFHPEICHLWKCLDLFRNLDCSHTFSQHFGLFFFFTNINGVSGQRKQSILKRYSETFTSGHKRLSVFVSGISGYFNCFLQDWHISILFYNTAMEQTQKWILTVFFLTDYPGRVSFIIF